jgi:alpha-mannosidase
MKYYNRKNELLADAAERTAVVAEWIGGPAYPSKTFTEAWRRFIWHQFHDDLTGTSIPRAYEFSWNDELISQKQFAQAWQSAAGSVAQGLNTQVRGIQLVVQNALGMDIKEVVEFTVEGLKPSGRDFTVYDSKGKARTVQYLSNEDGRTTLLMAANLPSVSFTVYDLTSDKTQSSSKLKISERTIENSVYKLTLNDNGDVSSILDKRFDRELVLPGKAIRLALFTTNESFSWPAWEILKKTMDEPAQDITGNVRISIAERGPLRASLSIERTHGESVFRQYIRLTEGGQDDRIDFVTEIDWQSQNALLKAEFPLAIKNEYATYDLGVGSIQRKNNTETAYEVYAQYWADLSEKDGSYGVAVLNNSKYGWDKPDDNTLRLTLLHTPKTSRGYAYQDRQDMGFHTFTYSLTAHNGDFSAGEVVAKAEALNQPPKAFTTNKHAGRHGRQLSFISIDNSRTVIKALKKAEKSDEYIIRVYETAGKGAEIFKLKFAEEIVEAKEVNSLEDSIGLAPVIRNELLGTITPFSIRTYSVKLMPSTTPVTPPRSLPIALNYKIKTATFNAFRTDANIDGRGFSYAAELLPKTLTDGGIEFILGDPASPNAIKCKGDTIILPQDGSYNRLYLLAASTYKDQVAKFTLDGKPFELYIPYYSGFVGQWRHTGHTEGFLKPADLAFIGTHRHSAVERKDMPYEYTYIFRYAIDIPATARELILTDNSRILLFAATLAHQVNDAVKPAVTLLSTALSKDDLAPKVISRTNLLKGRAITSMSGEGNGRYGGKATAAIDGDYETRWSDFASSSTTKYLEFDLGKEETLQGWLVFQGLGGRGNAANFLAKDYSLEVRTSPDASWQLADAVVDNAEPETDRLLPHPVKARYVRLSITRSGMNNNAAQIAEIEVY